jgi:hypothetical protein
MRKGLRWRARKRVQRNVYESGRIRTNNGKASASFLEKVTAISQPCSKEAMLQKDGAGPQAKPRRELTTPHLGGLTHSLTSQGVTEVCHPVWGEFRSAALT